VKAEKEFGVEEVDRVFWLNGLGLVLFEMLTSDWLINQSMNLSEAAHFAQQFLSALQQNSSSTPVSSSNAILGTSVASGGGIAIAIFVASLHFVLHLLRKLRVIKLGKDGLTIQSSGSPPETPQVTPKILGSTG
jgi:hypothetical protein